MTVASLRTYMAFYVTSAVPTLVNAGCDCNHCGGPLKVIVQIKKKKSNNMVWKVSLDEKFKRVFIILITFNQGTKYMW